MRFENNNGYSQESKAKKRNFRYTMIAALCICVVAAGAILTIRANPTLVGDDDKNINLEQSEDQRNVEGGQNVVKPVPTVDSKDNDNDNNSSSGGDQNGGSPQKSNSVLGDPVDNGKVTKGFSSDVPVYSKTLDQFAVHEGVDIDAPADTQVKAAAEGTVTKVAKDDKYGTTIEITHGSGLVTRYCNLSDAKLVEEGDVVKRGDVISGVGNSALFESLEAPHLHFEVLKDGIAVDPAQFF